MMILICGCGQPMREVCSYAVAREYVCDRCLTRVDVKAVRQNSPWDAMTLICGCDQEMRSYAVAPEFVCDRCLARVEAGAIQRDTPWADPRRPVEPPARSSSGRELTPDAPGHATLVRQPAVWRDDRPHLLVLSPEHAQFLNRVDPYTRTSFRVGEQAVYCGGCGNLYKLVTCQALEHRCPTDGVSLSPAAYTPFASIILAGSPEFATEGGTPVGMSGNAVVARQ